jgi:hypothetical protein
MALRGLQFAFPQGQTFGGIVLTVSSLSRARRRRPRAKLMAEYAKARIPKPPLAEVNFVMKALSDDDQALMHGALLIRLERGGGVGSTPNELARLAKGEGHHFTVRQVASAVEVVKTLEIRQREDLLLQQL